MIKRAMRFWSEENSLTALLIFLSFEIFLLFPLLRTGILLGLVNAFILSFLLLAGLLTIMRHRVLRSMATLFVFTLIIIHWLRVAGVEALALWDIIFTALALAGLTAVVLWAAIYREGPVTGHRIRGAITAYLLFAAFFACVYALIDYAYPGSLRFPEGGPAAKAELDQGYLYFSVVTISTLGYGDITPIHPWARSVAMLEAVIGPLYLTILLARLVSLQLEGKKSRSTHGAPKKPEQDPSSPD